MHVAKKPVLRLSWQYQEPFLLAAATGECFVTLFAPDGTVINRVKHPYDVFGVDYSTVARNLLATGCSDGTVRVFDTTHAAALVHPIATLRGHKGKVFAVKWSTLAPNLLATAGDDCVVRVWDVSTQQCVATLTGHTANVRALHWNSEVPHLLCSAGWDGPLRLWDIRSQSLLSSHAAHAQDVYAITSHPENPFVYVSAARDGTIREWYDRGRPHIPADHPRAFCELPYPCCLSHRCSALQVPFERHSPRARSAGRRNLTARLDAHLDRGIDPLHRPLGAARRHPALRVGIAGPAAGGWPPGPQRPGPGRRLGVCRPGPAL